MRVYIKYINDYIFLSISNLLLNQFNLLPNPLISISTAYYHLKSPDPNICLLAAFSMKYCHPIHTNNWIAHNELLIKRLNELMLNWCLHHENHQEAIDY